MVVQDVLLRRFSVPTVGFTVRAALFPVLGGALQSLAADVFEDVPMILPETRLPHGAPRCWSSGEKLKLSTALLEEHFKRIYRDPSSTFDFQCCLRRCRVEIMVRNLQSGQKP